MVKVMEVHGDIHHSIWLLHNKKVEKQQLDFTVNSLSIDPEEKDHLMLKITSKKSGINKSLFAQKIEYQERILDSMQTQLETPMENQDLSSMDKDTKDSDLVLRTTEL